MENIICDTCIWYNLSDKKHNLDKTIHLIGTSVNLSEFAYSKRIISDVETLKKAFIAFKRYSYSIITTNPFDYVISIYDNNYKPNDLKTKSIIDALERLLLIKKSDNILETAKLIDSHIEKLNSAPKVLNNALPQIRNSIKKNIGKGKYNRINNFSELKDYFAEIINDYSKKELDRNIRLNEINFDWTQIEFFLEVWHKYFKLLEMSNNWKVDRNDFTDLVNMVYVKPKFKYWTTDKKWINIFKDIPEISNYLFFPTL